jgi:hypothetical protein
MSQGQKIGAGHAAGMARSGLKELGQAVVAFPAHSVQPVEEPGIFGNLTPQEIVNGKGVEPGYDAMLNGYSARIPAQPDRSAGIER